MNNIGGTFIGFAGVILLASVLCAPALGWGGIFSAFVTVYFCLVLTNGADSASKRHNKKRR
jgi:hypothetical protein